MNTTLEIWPAKWLQNIHWTFWEETVKNNFGLNSPFFDINFFKSIISYQPYSYSMVFKSKGGIIAMLPFEVATKNRARLLSPDIVGLHGLIIHKDNLNKIDLKTAIKKAGLRYLLFDQVPGWQSTFNPFTRIEDNAPNLILSKSIERTKVSWKNSGQNTFVNIDFKTRKLEKKGRLTYIFDTVSPLLFRYLSLNKQNQFYKTGEENLFSTKEFQSILNYLKINKSNNCKLVLSALYLDNIPIAAHLGLSSKKTFYSWYPVMDKKIGNDSPELVLFGYIINTLHKKGYKVLDFGTQPMLYKTRLSNSSYKIKRGLIRP
ncbi:MAG: GNAT family N-acetyltransferase [Halarcobacter sp.]